MTATMPMTFCPEICLSGFCDFCGKAADKGKGVTLKKCGSCGRQEYCGRECQAGAWKEGGHNRHCKMSVSLLKNFGRSTKELLRYALELPESATPEKAYDELMDAQLVLYLDDSLSYFDPDSPSKRNGRGFKKPIWLKEMALDLLTHLGLDLDTCHGRYTWSLLHTAADLDDVPLILALHRRGANINLHTNRATPPARFTKSTPLHLSARTNAMNAARCLLVSMRACLLSARAKTPGSERWSHVLGCSPPELTAHVGWSKLKAMMTSRALNASVTWEEGVDMCFAAKKEDAAVGRRLLTLSRNGSVENILPTQVFGRGSGAEDGTEEGRGGYRDYRRPMSVPMSPRSSHRQRRLRGEDAALAIPANKGADPNAVNQARETPMFMANTSEMLLLLEEKGGKTNLTSQLTGLSLGVSLSSHPPRHRFYHETMPMFVALLTNMFSYQENIERTEQDMRAMIDFCESRGQKPLAEDQDLLKEVVAVVQRKSDCKAFLLLIGALRI